MILILRCSLFPLFLCIHIYIWKYYIQHFTVLPISQDDRHRYIFDKTNKFTIVVLNGKPSIS